VTGDRSDFLIAETGFDKAGNGLVAQVMESQVDDPRSF
jgi:hypothetical protein